MAEYYVVTRGHSATVHGPFATIEDAFSKAEEVVGQIYKDILVVELKGIVKSLVVIETEVFD